MNPTSQNQGISNQRGDAGTVEELKTLLVMKFKMAEFEEQNKPYYGTLRQIECVCSEQNPSIERIQKILYSNGLLHVDLKTDRYEEQRELYYGKLNAIKGICDGNADDKITAIPSTHKILLATQFIGKKLNMDWIKEEKTMIDERLENIKQEFVIHQNEQTELYKNIMEVFTGYSVYGGESEKGFDSEGEKIVS
jgi:hypothetical protein